MFLVIAVLLKLVEVETVFDVNSGLVICLDDLETFACDDECTFLTCFLFELLDLVSTLRDLYSSCLLASFIALC